MHADKIKSNFAWLLYLLAVGITFWHNNQKLFHDDTLTDIRIFVSYCMRVRTSGYLDLSFENYSNFIIMPIENNRLSIFK
jgi:hypothetical protein